MYIFKCCVCGVCVCVCVYNLMNCFCCHSQLFAMRGTHLEDGSLRLYLLPDILTDFEREGFTINMLTCLTKHHFCYLGSLMSMVPPHFCIAGSCRCVSKMSKCSISKANKPFSFR